MQGLASTVAGSLVKLILLLATAMVLGGCPAPLVGSADLSGIVPTTQPLRDGKYELEAGLLYKATAQLSHGDGGTYLLQFEQTASGNEEGTTMVQLFGPVGGHYIAQWGTATSQNVSYFVIKLGPNDTILFSNATIYGLLGELVFDRWGLPADSGSTVDILTGNAALNWVMLQELVVRYRHRMEFEVFMTRLGD